jgi:glycerol-3-phosphate dehydrogenase
MPVDEVTARAKVMLTLMDGFFRRTTSTSRSSAASRTRASPPTSCTQLEPGLRVRSRGRDVLRRVGHRRRAPVHGQRPRRPRARREDPRRHHHRVDRAQARQTARWSRPLARSAQRAHRPHDHERVVNATGAWAPITAALGGLEAKRARIRPGKGIHVAYDRRLTNYAIGAATIDGRQIFVEPWQNMTVVGTTDDDYYGDLDDVHREQRGGALPGAGDRAGLPGDPLGASDPHLGRRATHPLRLRQDGGRAEPRARGRRSRTPTARRACTR